MVSTPSLRNNRFVVLTYLCFSSVVFGIWVWGAETPSTSFNGDPRSKLSDLIYGTAHNPYVRRILVPAVARTIYGFLPRNWWDGLENSLLAIPKIQKEIKRLGWEEEYLAEYVIALTVTSLSLLCFPFIARRLWSTLYTTQQEVNNAVPLIALAFLPTLFGTGPHYLYDFPTLVLFNAGLVFLLRRNWMAFYPVYIAACMNKETTIFLSIVFLLVFLKTMKRHALIQHLIIQFLIIVLVRYMLLTQFASNPGSSLEFHLFANIHCLLLGYGAATLLTTAFLAFFVLHDFRKKHEVLQKLSLLIFPFVGLMLLFGSIAELRDMYEIFLVFVLLGTHTLISMLNIPFRLNPIDASRASSDVHVSQ